MRVTDTVLDFFFGKAEVSGTTFEITVNRMSALIGNRNIGWKFVKWEEVNTGKKIKAFIAREFYNAETFEKGVFKLSGI